MRLDLLVLVALPALGGCFVAPPQDADTVPAPMESFARLEAGAWRKGTLQMHEVWTWGPGRYSIRGITYGRSPEGGPWRELRVAYWHPGSEEVRLFGQHLDIPNLGRGVVEGTFRFEGETADARFGLSQPGHPLRDVRQMGARWEFSGPDAFHETLLEASSGSHLTPLADWPYVRTNLPSAVTLHPGGAAPRPSDNLKPFGFLMGKTWEARGEWGGEPLHVRSTVEWLDYLDTVYVRTVSVSDDGEPTHLFDTYLYHHVGDDGLHALSLSRWGAVYEGEIAVFEDGMLRMDLAERRPGKVLSHVLHLGADPDSSLRAGLRAETTEGASRALDLVHESVSKDD